LVSGQWHVAVGNLYMDPAVYRPAAVTLEMVEFYAYVGYL